MNAKTWQRNLASNPDWIRPTTFPHVWDALLFKKIREIDQIIRLKRETNQVKYSQEQMDSFKVQYEQELLLLDQLRAWQRDQYSFDEMLTMLASRRETAWDGATVSLADHTRRVGEREYEVWLFNALKIRVQNRLRRTESERFISDNAEMITQNLFSVCELDRNMRVPGNIVPDESVAEYKKAYPEEIEIVKEAVRLRLKGKKNHEIQDLILGSLQAF